jgi:hypothetical protein
MAGSSNTTSDRRGLGFVPTVGLVSALVGLLVFITNGDWRALDPRAAEAAIVSVSPTEDRNDRAVEVAVDCDVLDHKTEQWLAVWKEGDPAVALWPVDGYAKCGTWTSRFNVGAVDEDGHFVIALYEVSSEDADRWEDAKTSDRHLYRADLPEDEPLASITYDRGT